MSIWMFGISDILSPSQDSFVMKAVSQWVAHFIRITQWLAQQMFLSQSHQLERLAKENGLLSFFKKLNQKNSCFRSNQIAVILRGTGKFSSKEGEL